MSSFTRISRLRGEMRKKKLKLSNEKLKKAIGKHAPKVAIASSTSWANRVTDDLLIERELLHNGIAADIISWQDNKVDYKKYDAVLVGSMWGYQRELDTFWAFLEQIEKNKVPMINPIQIIRENCNKVSQFQLLRKIGLPVVETEIIETGKLNDWKMPSLEKPSGAIVIKPAISGGGDNTFLIHDKDELKKVKERLVTVNRKMDLLVQPYIPEVSNGEIGVVMIGGKIVNAVRRFPGVIDGHFRVEPVAKIDEKLRTLAEQAWKAYLGISYLRVDTVEIDGEHVIMEVEAFEPQLYYYLLKGSAQEEMLHAMCNEVKKVLGQDSTRKTTRS